MNRRAIGPAPEHEFEAAPGLPEPLPRGERLLWQGSPDWRLMARGAMHVRALAVYFGILLVWRVITVLTGDGSIADAALAVAWLMPLAVLALGALSLMAWLISKTSVYTITDRRVVMRIGVVLSITFNLPLSKIDAAALRSDADGTGDVTLLLDASDRIAYVHLWPHAKPWELKRTQPMLRALPEAGRVAGILSAALGVQAAVAEEAASVVSIPLSRPHPSPLPQAVEGVHAVDAPTFVSLGKPPRPLAGEGWGEGAAVATHKNRAAA